MTPMMPPPQQPLASPQAPPTTQIKPTPDLASALKAIAEGMKGLGGAGPTAPPLDKNSPDYKKAVMDQLAAGAAPPPATNAMGALGTVLRGANAGYQQQQAAQAQKQADMMPWMPVVTKA